MAFFLLLRYFPYENLASVKVNQDYFMMWLYHYTSEQCLTSIVQSKTIRPSPKGKFGSGVYFSRLSPKDLPLEMLAENLFGAGGPARLCKGRLKCYIEIFVKNHGKGFEKCQDKRGRDIFIYRGEMYLRYFFWNGDFVVSANVINPVSNNSLCCSTT